MPAVHVRFDDVDGILEEVMEYMPKLKPERYIVAEETGKLSGKKHYHMYIETDKNDNAVRNNLNNNCSKFRSLPARKNCKYCKSWGDQFDDRRYFCKENKIRYIKGFTW